ncbi:phosphotransferase [Aequorivita sp. CIP111184]|uniref:phosphotransferase n=1 Tax=Aequorivita sp. CIP111184 TaxID=2211356 RepID=UPI000DBBF969|nr:phosphotransferase [Aequorivita sp. CIP111184]SRX55342.1 hypothetical protein AEQU1_02364 [Aequorivita sp. CIP111184]
MKHKIEEIDQILCDKYNLVSKNYTYRRFGSNYVKSAIWPFGVYMNIKSHSELSVIPSTYKRRWINLLVGNQEYSLTDLSGPLLGWFFLRRYVFQVQANFIFYKEQRAGLILLYKDLDIVLKANLVTDLDNVLIEYKQTKEAYNQAEVIGILKVPNVFFHFYAPNKYSFFLQERIKGTTLQRLPTEVIAKNIEKMCDFLFLFYQQNKVSLKSPEIDIEKMENIISLFYGKEILFKFLSIKKHFHYILKEEKKCFWGKIHGDIHTRNLIVDKHDNLWLIDWQASKYDFIAVDFRKIRNNDYLFKKLLILFPSQQTEIMNIIDQVFIGHLLRLERSLFEHKRGISKQVLGFIDLLYRL